MTVSYKKLWKLLIDKDMKKKDLEKAAGISNYVISKMNKGENITVDIVGKDLQRIGLYAQRHHGILR